MTTEGLRPGTGLGIQQGRSAKAAWPAAYPPSAPIVMSILWRESQQAAWADSSFNYSKGEFGPNRTG